MKTLSYETFLPEIRLAVQKESPDDVSVSIIKIMKNNGVAMDAMTIMKEGHSSSPTIYLAPYYEDYSENGTDMDTIAGRIIDRYRQALLPQNPDFKEFRDFEKIKDRIIFRVVNLTLNKPLLGDVPHVCMPDLDLAVTFCVLLDIKEKADATVLIHNDHLKLWDAGPDTVHELAMENTPRLLPSKLKKLSDIIGAMAEEKTVTDCGFPELYVLTNANCIFGAGCIVYDGLLRSISARLGGDLYVLPSSVHETLLFAAGDFDAPEELHQMICEVNDAQVAPHEVLGSYAMFYSSKEDRLTLLKPAAQMEDRL